MRLKGKRGSLWGGGKRKRSEKEGRRGEGKKGTGVERGASLRVDRQRT